METQLKASTSEKKALEAEVQLLKARHPLQIPAPLYSHLKALFVVVADPGEGTTGTGETKGCGVREDEGCSRHRSPRGDPLEWNLFNDGL